jgi:alpha-mannosidase
VNERFTADQYRSPSLEQAMSSGQPDPISSVVEKWKSHNNSDTLTSAALLNELLGNDSSVADLAADDGNVAQHSLDAFSHGLQRGDSGESGLLVMNPSSHVQRVDLQNVQLDTLPFVAPPVYAVGHGSGNGAHVIVDVPAMGFAWVAASGGKSTVGQEMAAERMLRNDFFEVLINETTGGIQSINSHADPRHGRGSLQLAYRQAVRKKSGRLAEPDDVANYSVMAADSIKVTAATPTRGEITSTGRLMHRNGETLATFEQVFSVERGNRVLGIETKLDILQEPVNKPWNSYYCLRYAWGDEAANLTRGMQGTAHGASSKRLVAPEYIEIESEKKTTLLTGGLPYHRRVGRRFLDSILVVSGETCRSFQVGIGVDLDQSQIAAQQFQQAPMVAVDSKGEPSGHNSSSLLHLGARNLVATHWQTVLQAEVVVGLQVRIMETAGRSVRTKLATFRPVVSAVQQNLDGSPLGECNVEDGQVVLDMTGHEWLQIELRF